MTRFSRIHFSCILMLLLSIPHGMPAGQVDRQEEKIIDFLLYYADYPIQCTTDRIKAKKSTWADKLILDKVVEGLNIKDIEDKIESLIDLQTPLNTDDDIIFSYAEMKVIMLPSECEHKESINSKDLKTAIRRSFQSVLILHMSQEDYQKKRFLLTCNLVANFIKRETPMEDSRNHPSQLVINEVKEFVRTKYQKPTSGDDSKLNIKDIENLVQSAKELTKTAAYMSPTTTSGDSEAQKASKNDFLKCYVNIEVEKLRKDRNLKKLSPIHNDYVDNFILRNYDPVKRCQATHDETEIKTLATTIISNTDSRMSTYQHEGLVNTKLTTMFRSVSDTIDNEDDIKTVEWAVNKALLRQSQCLSKELTTTPEHKKSIHDSFQRHLKSVLPASEYETKNLKFDCAMDKALEELVNRLGATLPVPDGEVIAEVYEFVRTKYRKPTDTDDSHLNVKDFENLLESVKKQTKTEKFLLANPIAGTDVLRCYVGMKVEHFRSNTAVVELSGNQITFINKFLLELYDPHKECKAPLEDNIIEDLAAAIISNSDSGMSAYEHWDLLKMKVKDMFKAFSVLPDDVEDKKLITWVVNKVMLRQSGCQVKAPTTTSEDKQRFRANFQSNIKEVLPKAQYEAKNLKFACTLDEAFEALSTRLGDTFTSPDKKVIDEIQECVRKNYRKPTVGGDLHLKVGDIENLLETCKRKPETKKFMLANPTAGSDVLMCFVGMNVESLRSGPPVSKLSEEDDKFILNFILNKKDLDQECIRPTDENLMKALAADIISHSPSHMSMYKYYDHVFAKVFKTFSVLTTFSESADDDEMAATYMVNKIILRPSECKAVAYTPTSEELDSIHHEFQSLLDTDFAEYENFKDVLYRECSLRQALKKLSSISKNDVPTLSPDVNKELWDVVRKRFYQPDYVDDLLAKIRDIENLVGFIITKKETKKFLLPDETARTEILRCYVIKKVEAMLAAEPLTELPKNYDDIAEKFILEQQDVDEECKDPHNANKMEDLANEIITNTESDMSVFEHLDLLVKKVTEMFSDLSDLNMDDGEKKLAMFAINQAVLGPSRCEAKAPADTSKEIENIRSTYHRKIAARTDKKEYQKNRVKYTCYFTEVHQKLLSYFVNELTEHFPPRPVIDHLREMVRRNLRRPTADASKSIGVEDIETLFNSLAAEQNIQSFLSEQTVLRTEILRCHLGLEVEWIRTGPLLSALTPLKRKFVEGFIYSHKNLRRLCENSNDENVLTDFTTEIILDTKSGMNMYQYPTPVKARVKEIFSTLSELKEDEKEQLSDSLVRAVMLPSNCTRVASASTSEDLKKIMALFHADLKANLPTESYERKFISYTCQFHGELNKLTRDLGIAEIPTLPQTVIKDVEWVVQNDLPNEASKQNTTILTHKLAQNLLTYTLSRAETAKYLKESQKDSSKNFLRCVILQRAKMSLVSLAGLKPTPPPDPKPTIYLIITITITSAVIAALIGYLVYEYGYKRYKKLKARPRDTEEEYY